MEQRRRCEAGEWFGRIEVEGFGNMEASLFAELGPLRRVSELRVSTTVVVTMSAVSSQ